MGSNWEPELVPFIEYGHQEHKHTVKASNFGPHSNLWTVFPEGLKLRPTKNEGCRKVYICQLDSVHCWCIIHPRKLWISHEKVQCFHEVQSKRLSRYLLVWWVLFFFQLTPLPDNTSADPCKATAGRSITTNSYAKYLYNKTWLLNYDIRDF